MPEAPPATSQTQEEARALDAQIRALMAEIEAAGFDPQDDAPADVSADLDEQIATLEGEIAHGNNASD